VQHHFHGLIVSSSSLAIRILRSRRVDDSRFRIPDESPLPIASLFPPSRSAGITAGGKKSVDFIASTFSQAIKQSTKREPPHRTRQEPNWALEHVPELF
jgi:hypothetical protein